MKPEDDDPEQKKQKMRKDIRQHDQDIVSK